MNITEYLNSIVENEADEFRKEKAFFAGVYYNQLMLVSKLHKVVAPEVMQLTTEYLHHELHNLFDFLAFDEATANMLVDAVNALVKQPVAANETVQ